MTVTRPRVIESVLGHETDAGINQALDDLRHHGAVDLIHLPPSDLDRRRLRVTSVAGRDYALALPRDSSLSDGSVLLLDSEAALVVRAKNPVRMRLRAITVEAALRLGFVAGHLHWKCDQDGDTLAILLEGPAADYLDRISQLVESGDLVEITSVST